MEKKNTLVIEIEGTNKVEKLENDLDRVELKTVKAISSLELMKSIFPDTSLSVKNIERVVPALASLVPIIGEIEKMSKEALDKSSALSASRQKQLEEEIKSIKKVADNIITLNTAYKAKEELIIQQSQISRKKALDEIEEHRKTIAKKIEELRKSEKNETKQIEERKQYLIILEQQAADKILEIDTKLKEDLKKNSEELKKVHLELLNPVKNKKGFIDIDATKENVGRAVDALKKYKTEVLITENTVVNSYNLMIKAAGDDKEKVEQLTKEKAAAKKNYAAQVKEIEKQITQTEKKENALRLEQWKGYFEKVSSLADSLKSTMTKTSGYLGTALGAISSAYKAEIDAIDEQIKHAQNKNKEFTQEYANQSAEIAAITAQSTARKNELKREGLTDEQINNDETIKSLASRQEEEQKIQDDMLAQKQKIERKERELQAAKAKKQTEQEKIEKLNRKATLIKDIGEATASVAKGITKALAYGPFLGPALATIVATAGAIQIGIMSNQLAKFADGGLLNGKRHSQGGMRIEGTNIEVEGGEYVVNRESTSKNLGLVRYINSQRKELTPADMTSFFSKASQGYEPPFRKHFEAGGQIPAIEAPNSLNHEILVNAIKSIKIEPKVAVTDIIRAQDEAVQVDGWAGN